MNDNAPTDLPFRPDWIDTVRRVTLQLMPQAYDEGVGVLAHLAEYEKSQDLGGSKLVAVLMKMASFKKALGLAQLPEGVEGHGFVYLTF